MVSNYYEMLGLATDANTADIHRAVDNRYNEMRQLATHPDATVVEEANRNLRLLEQMRATLTDASRRAAYDAGIGVGGAGGLADPAAILRKATPPPPPRVIMPTPSPSAAPANAAPDLWVCPKCDTRNPEWTQFCLKCQNEMVRQCPECGQMKSLVKTGVCGHCGFSFDAATRRIALNGKINSVLGQVSAHQANVAKMTEEMKAKRVNVFYTIIAMVASTLLFSFLAFVDGSLKLILVVLITIGGGVFLVQHNRGAARALTLRIASEQETVVKAEREIKQLREEHEQLGTRKRL